MAKLKLHYNSPVVLTFAFVSAIILVINAVSAGSVTPFVSIGQPFSFANPLDWLRLFTHVLGHGSVAHLAGNLMLLLLLGPILEEKYGSGRLLTMMALTAAITGLLQVSLFDSSLLGASGIVFMLILLASITNAREGHIPLTMLLVVVLYLGQEIAASVRADNVSQFAHIVGGLCGAAFGFIPRLGHR
jgi:membrane associated rhomboid family serine protease